MKNASKTLSENSERDATMESAARRVAEKAHSAIDHTASKAEAVERQLRENAAKAGERVDETQEIATQKVEQSIEKLEGFVKSQPMTAAGIAFAAGILTTAILRR